MITISKVAAHLGITADAVRYYEQEGLLKPSAKSGGGYRLYDADAIRRLRFIRHAQECGFTLAEIRQLLTMRASSATCCSDIRRVALEKKLQLEAKIRSMKSMSRLLDELINTCTDGAGQIDDCPILTALDHVGQRAARTPA